MSLLNDILTAVKTSVDAVGVTVNGSAVTSAIRKLPKREDSIDPAAQICISAAEKQPDVVPYCFGNRFLNKIIIEITLINPNNDDQASYISDYSNFKQSVTNKLMVPTGVTVSNLRDTRIRENPFLDREMIRNGYDYIQLLLECNVIVTAT